MLNLAAYQLKDEGALILSAKIKLARSYLFISLQMYELKLAISKLKLDLLAEYFVRVIKMTIFSRFFRRHSVTEWRFPLNTPSQMRLGVQSSLRICLDCSNTSSSSKASSCSLYSVPPYSSAIPRHNWWRYRLEIFFSVALALFSSLTSDLLEASFVEGFCHKRLKQTGFYALNCLCTELQRRP